MTRYDPAAIEGLQFRRQFVLGPRFVDRFPSWRRLRCAGNRCLTVHPDLGASQVDSGDRSAVLLGYILDPMHPGAGDGEILSGILDGLRTCDEVVDRTARFGGRWVLVVFDGVRAILCTDAAGLRQVVYTVAPQGGPLWCASQPGLLAEVADLAPDAEASDFVRLAQPTHRNFMVWLPGDATPYAAARQLLPNHCLDLDTGRAERCWPARDLPVLRLRAGIDRSAELLHGLMESAGRRYELMLAMTAGWDSRLTLAAARAVSSRASFYTAVFHNTAEGDLDVTTPGALLGKLGLKRLLLDCRTPVDDAFAGTYRRNVTLAHEQYGAVAQALHEGTAAQAVCVTGDVGEIAKCTYRLGPSDRNDVAAHELARLAGLPAHPFAVRAFDAWLMDARAGCRNVPLMDLYYWEMEAGRLQAMIQAECDIAREAFAPLNCRSLLTTMLSVPERFRRGPRYDFFRLLIARLWPAVLREPINGVPQTGAEAVLRRALDDVGLLRLVPKPLKQAVAAFLRGAL